MAKTNSGLVEYCKAKIGCYYWFGTFGQMASKTLYTQKSKQYPNKYTASDFEKQIANPKQVFDCSGLIKAYLWTKSIDDTKPKYDAKTDYGATAFYDNSTYKGKISVFPKKPGMLVFKGTSKTKSHVGVYVGNDTVIEAKGHKYGVVETKFSTGDWDYWAQCNLITEDFVTPEPAPAPAPTKSIDEVAKEVIAGKWGNDPERKKALIAAGYDRDAVQKRVTEMLKKPTPGENALKQYTTYIVDPEKVHSVLNVRATPNGKIVGYLGPGTTVEILEENGEWVRIGTDRWVFKNYLTKHF